MVRQPWHTPMPPSPLWTVTVRLPGTALEVTVTVSSIRLPIWRITVAVTPVPEIVTVVLWLKPDPYTDVSVDVPRASEFGDMLVAVGAGSTVKHAEQVRVEASGSVIVMSRVPAAAAVSTVIVATRRVGVATDTAVVVIPAPKDTVAPAVKSLP